MSQKNSIISELPQEILEKSTLHMSLSEGFILTTEDKIRISLNKYIECLGRSGCWIAPLGIFLTIIVTLFTADFKGVLFLTKDLFKAIFIVIAFVCFYWLIKAFFKSTKVKTVDDIISDLKLESKELSKNESSDNVDNIEFQKTNLNNAQISPIVLNYLYEKKGVNFEELLKELKTDYASLKYALKFLELRRMILSYIDENDKRIYCLQETKNDALSKYPKQIESEVNISDIPF